MMSIIENCERRILADESAPMGEKSAIRGRVLLGNLPLGFFETVDKQSNRPPANYRRKCDMNEMLILLGRIAEIDLNTLENAIISTRSDLSY